MVRAISRTTKNKYLRENAIAYIRAYRLYVHIQYVNVWWKGWGGGGWGFFGCMYGKSRVLSEIKWLGRADEREVQPWRCERDSAHWVHANFRKRSEKNREKRLKLARPRL